MQNLKSASVHRLALVACALGMVATCTAPVAGQQLGSELKKWATDELRLALTVREKWVKVHAAEALLGFGFDKEVAREFECELNKFGNEAQYRIGIWRVLAKATDSKQEATTWTNRIERAFYDTDSPDRIHAAEALAKLQVEIPKQKLDAVLAAARGDDRRLAPFTRWWVAAVTKGEPRDESLLALWSWATKADQATMRTAAYALRHLGETSESNWKRLVTQSLGESDRVTQARLLSTAWVVAPRSASEEKLSEVRQRLAELATAAKPVGQKDLCAALEKKGMSRDIALLTKLFHIGRNTPDATPDEKTAAADIRIFAAQALLKIDRRTTPSAATTR